MVVTTLLQMGWIEPPPYLCTVSETGRDVAEQYIETPVGSLAEHKFVELAEVNSEIAELKNKDTSKEPFNYMVEVYMDDYIVLAITRIQDKLRHISNAIMTGIHDVFPQDKDDKEDAISLKKILKRNMHGQLFRMCWDLNFMETQESIPYVSLRTAVQIF